MCFFFFLGYVFILNVLITFMFACVCNLTVGLQLRRTGFTAVWYPARWSSWEGAVCSDNSTAAWMSPPRSCPSPRPGCFYGCFACSRGSAGLHVPLSGHPSVHHPLALWGRRRSERWERETVLWLWPEGRLQSIVGAQSVFLLGRKADKCERRQAIPQWHRKQRRHAGGGDVWREC